MPVIESRLNTRDAVFAQNRDAMAALVADLREKLAVIEQGGGAAPSAKHTARGKLLPRERVRALLDAGSPFLEFSQLAAHGMYQDNIAAGGIITGIGRVSGQECVIVCNDATVKGGTYYPLTVKKHLRAQDIARETTCPASIWSTRAAPTCPTNSTCFRTATTSGASSTTRRRCRRWGFRRSRW